MSLTIDLFRSIAVQTNDAPIQLSGGRPGGLEKRGFWSRLFGRADSQAAKNQAAMREFCNAVTREMGGDLGQAAKAFLGGALAARKPLNGYIIQTTLAFLETEKGRIVQHNQDALARFLTPQPGQDKSPLEEKLAQYLPQGVTLEEGDQAEIVRRLRQTVDQETASNHPITQQGLGCELNLGFKSALQHTDAAFMERLDRLGRDGLPPNITGEQIRDLRPLIIAAGVRKEGDLRAALELMLELRDTIPQMRNLTDSVGLMTFLEGIDAVKTRIFAANQVGPRSDAADIMNLAWQGAFKLGGTPEDASKIGEIMCGHAGQDILNLVHGAADRNTYDPANFAYPIKAMTMKGMLQMLLNPLSVMGVVNEGQTNAMSQLGGGEVSPRLKGYCHLKGMVPDAEQKKVFEAFAPMASLVNAPPMDLLQLSETLKASDFFERADG
ncbi:MAG: hypothetical protein LBU23_08775, partial [Planctomycetota bacterium]|nr:hypothetical protein [Planctomycetota bacterium]